VLVLQLNAVIFYLNCNLDFFESSLNQPNSLATRVTRLGEFSPMGMPTLDSFVKLTDVDHILGYFFHGLSMYMYLGYAFILTKMC
jgi:hypothetical protein